MKFTLLIAGFILSSPLFAGVEAFTTTSMQKLFIEEAPEFGKDTYLVMFSRVTDKWNDKIIKTKMNKATSNHYQFDYVLELSNGKHNRVYNLVTREGEKKVKLWNQSHAKDGIPFTWDKELTKESQGIKLVEEFKKKPFTPDVD